MRQPLQAEDRAKLDRAEEWLSEIQTRLEFDPIDKYRHGDYWNSVLGAAHFIGGSLIQIIQIDGSTPEGVISLGEIERVKMVLDGCLELVTKLETFH